MPLDYEPVYSQNTPCQDGLCTYFFVMRHDHTPPAFSSPQVTRGAEAGFGRLPGPDWLVWTDRTPRRDTSADAGAGGGACHTGAVRVVFDPKWVPVVQKNTTQVHLATAITPIVQRASPALTDKKFRNT